MVVGLSKRSPSTYDVLRAHGIDRRDFLKFCTTTAAVMGLEAVGDTQNRPVGVTSKPAS